MKLDSYGFTLIEVLIVLAIGVIAMGFLSIFGNKFLLSQELERAVELTKSEIRAAQMDSISGTHDSSWGIAFLKNYVVRFRGESYDSRMQSFDYLTNFNSSLIISGPSEIVFSRIDGSISVGREIIFSLHNDEKIINISTKGVISGP